MHRSPGITSWVNNIKLNSRKVREGMHYSKRKRELNFYSIKPRILNIWRKIRVIWDGPFVLHTYWNTTKNSIFWELWLDWPCNQIQLQNGRAHVIRCSQSIMIIENIEKYERAEFNVSSLALILRQQQQRQNCELLYNFGSVC